MEQSILKSVKLFLGLDPEYDAFDQDVLMCINAAFGVITDLGVGPETGLTISDDTQMWDILEEDQTQTNQVKQFIFLHTRKAFDPPQTGPLVGVISEQLAELVWRISVRRKEATV
jgi:hypothetical protein